MTDPFPLIADMVKDSERHAEDMSTDRMRAIEYYRGEMTDLPHDKGRSGMVSRDLRAHVKKVLPAVMRTILGGDNVVEFEPVGQGDEEAAEQATDFMNHVLIGEADARRSIESAVHDALLQRNGILKWWHEAKQVVKISRHSGLTDDALAVLAGDDSVEVLEHSEAEAMTEAGPVLLHDVKIRRVTTEKKYRTAAVPRERFLIHPDAVTLQESLLTGEKTEVRRSDLIAMGYDRNLVDNLSIAQREDDERDDRRDFQSQHQTEAERANQPIDYYDLYVRMDMDGDGIAELRHMVFAGGLKEQNLLENEECDEVQFCDVAVMRQPHQWEGISLYDDLRDLQQAKTVLLRQTLDNLYWQNNPQPVMVDGVVKNPDAVYSPEFGLPIHVREGVDARMAVQFMQVPFVAQASFGMLDYLDAEATDRTGISDASAGLAPDALQNMTATASAMIEQASIGQTEMMVRTIADGLRVFFRGLLRLIVRHQDVPRTVRLRGEWVQMDPRQWQAEMDCSVNTGLGAGTRERDMATMMNVLALQEKLIAGFGAVGNPFVKAQHLSATMSKLVESAGLRTPSLYFHQPTEEEIAAMEQAAQSQPSEADIKAQEVQAKLQAHMAEQRMTQETTLVREKAQRDADLAVKRAEIEAEAIRQRDELASKAALQARQLAFEREKFAAEVALKREDMAQRRSDEILRAQADAFRQRVAAANDPR